MEWSSTAPWLKSELKSTHILRGVNREIPILSIFPIKPGLYRVLIGDDKDVPGVEIEIPVNIIIGVEIDNKRPYVYTVMDSLAASQFARYFITVPEGTNYLEAELADFPILLG